MTGCPKEYVTSDVWDVLEGAELYEKGLPPVAGGIVDQCKCFTQSCRMIWREQRYWKNKLGIT